MDLWEDTAKTEYIQIMPGKQKFHHCNKNLISLIYFLLSFPNKIPHCICGNHSLLNEEIVYTANCLRAEITMKAAENSK